MPEKKKWIVDEKGFHSVSVFESAPSDKTAVYIDDSSIQNNNNEEKYEIELVKGTWLEGDDGFQFNKKCKVRVEAKFLKDTSRKKITIDTFVEYNGETEDLGQQVEGYIDDKGIAEAEVMLFYGEKYSKVLEEKPEAVCTYTFKVKSSVAEKEIVSEELEMPQKEKITVIMKKGRYDDKGASAFDKLKSGDNYLAGDNVYKLQNDLITMGFFSVGKPDGFFGDKTDKVVREFQKLSKEELRKKDDKNIEVELTYTDSVDGVVGEKTAKEIETWLNEGYTKPFIEIKKGHFDDEAVKQNLKEQESEEHIAGEQIRKLQKDLKELGFEDVGKDDGDFGEKTEKALSLFQKIALGVDRLIEGVIDTVEKTFGGKENGVLDEETQKEIELWKNKGLKAPKGNVIKKGDKGKIVEEINIRLTGFGGGVPSDTFDEVTETKVKNFQELYMKKEKSSGVVDEETAKAIDEFREKYDISTKLFDGLKCKCGSSCGGFGKKRHKGEYFSQTESEKSHKYEYPGIHRSLLWAVFALKFQLERHPDVKAKLYDFSSGYRCHDHSIVKKKKTTNHMGKAVDIRFQTLSNGKWIRPSSESEKNTTVEAVRKQCTESKELNAQYKWNTSNTLSMETTAQGAKTWVHIDVRTFESKHLNDKFFCKSLTQLKGDKMEDILKKGSA